MKHLINELAQILLNTRDFCGDEREAIKDFLRENKIKLGSPEAAEICEPASRIARREWNYSRSAARR